MLTTHQIAEALETDDKSARRFLRTVMPHDKGKTWQVDEDQLVTLKLLYQIRKLGKEEVLTRLFSGLNKPMD